VIIGDGQIGVDDGDGDLLLAGVHKDLSQHAVVGVADVGVVVLVHVGGGEHSAVDLGVGHTVDDHVQGVVPDGAGAQQVIQILAGDLGGVLLTDQLILHVGADFLAVILPGAGG